VIEGTRYGNANPAIARELLARLKPQSTRMIARAIEVNK
jgi:hypothetical protein